MLAGEALNTRAFARLVSHACQLFKSCWYLEYARAASGSARNRRPSFANVSQARIAPRWWLLESAAVLQAAINGGNPVSAGEASRPSAFAQPASAVTVASNMSFDIRHPPVKAPG